MGRLERKNKKNDNQFKSSWSFKEILFLRIWKLIWLVFYLPSPKILNKWRIFLLRFFGADVSWNVFIYSSSKVFAPWLLKMEGRSCLGPNTNIYNLGMVIIKDRVTISQNSFVCNGTHDLSDRNLPLLVGEIIIEQDVFVGANALILPGLSIGEGAVIGAGSVVTKDVDPWIIVAGNPARNINKRVFNN